MDPLVQIKDLEVWSQLHRQDILYATQQGLELYRPRSMLVTTHVVILYISVSGSRQEIAGRLQVDRIEVTDMDAIRRDLLMSHEREVFEDWARRLRESLTQRNAEWTWALAWIILDQPKLLMYAPDQIPRSNWEGGDSQPWPRDWRESIKRHINTGEY